MFDAYTLPPLACALILAPCRCLFAAAAAAYAVSMIRCLSHAADTCARHAVCYAMLPSPFTPMLPPLIAIDAAAYFA